MFIKDNTLNREQHRIETRAAAAPAATPTIVDSGFNRAELDHIKAKVYAAFPTKSNSSFFKTWIENLFMDPAQSGLDLSEFNRILSQYRASHRARNILEDIIEGIKRTDFNTPENQKVMSDNAGKLMSGEWTHFDFLNNLNVVSGTPAGVMGPLNHYLNTQITKPLSTDNEVATTIIKDYIDAELKKYGITNGLSDTSYTIFLNNYLGSTDFTDDFKNIIDTAFLRAEHLDSTLTHFIKLDSFKALLTEEVKNELTSSNVKTRLAGNFFNVLNSMLFSELEKIAPNAVASITKTEAALLDGKDKLTLDEVQTLLPGSKAIFDAHPHLFEHTIFTGKYNGVRSHIILDGRFVYASTLAQAPLFQRGSEPHILINDERAVVDIAAERLQELLHNMQNRDMNDGDLITDIGSLTDSNGVLAWTDGNFHNISLAEFNTLTKANLNEATWKTNVGPKDFDYQIQIKINKLTHRLEYKFILKDDTAKAESLKRKEIHITDDQVTTGFHFMYEKIQMEIQRLEAAPMSSHNLLLIGDVSPVITSPTEVAKWFVDKITIIKNEIRAVLIAQFKRAYPTLVSDSRFEIRAYVDRFDHFDHAMKLRFTITDTSINLADGTHPTLTQAYRLKVEDVNSFYSTATNRALNESLKLLVGAKDSIFDAKNNPGSTDAPVPGPGGDWDASAAKLSDMLTMTGQVSGYPFSNFLDIYNYFKARNVHLTWEATVKKDPSGATELHGIMFHYSVNYFTDIFSSTEQTSNRIFNHFQLVERVPATDAYKADAIKAINDEKDRISNIVKLYGDKADELVKQVETIAQTGIDRINADNNISEKEVKDIKDITINSLKAIIAIGGASISDPWFQKLMALFGHNIPPDILKAIIDNQQFFKSLVESGASLESIKMLAKHKKLMSELAHLDPKTISKVLDGMKSMHDNYKYTYLGLGAGLGAAGALSGGLAVSSIRANKKLKQINNKQMKMRGTKIVSTIATLVSLSTLASSAVFMVLFFVNKGGF